MSEPTVRDNPDWEEILTAARGLAASTDTRLAVVCAPDLAGPRGPWSLHAEALARGEPLPGFFEAWPALETRRDAHVTVRLTAYAAGRTPEEVLDLPGIVAGNVLFGVDASAFVADEPGLTMSVGSVDDETAILKLLDADNDRIPSGTGTISPDELNESREKAAWRTLPTVRRLADSLKV